MEATVTTEIADTKSPLEQPAQSEQLGEICSGSALTTWLDLVRVYEKMHRHLMDHLYRYDLSIAQYDVLAHLSQKPGSTQAALAQELSVTKGNICKLIDRMSAHGLVERRADPDDRRPNLLHLTPEGERLAKEAVPAYAEFVREHMSGVTDEQLAALREGLRAIESSIHEH